MYDHETSDMEDLETFDHESIDGMNGEGAWNGEEEADPFLGDIVGGLLGESDMEDLEGYDRERDEFFPLIAAAAPLLAKAVPLIGRGVKAVGKLMRGRRATRPAIRALPRIAANTAASLARQARSGRQITPRNVAATMARQTTRALSTPRRFNRVARQNRTAAARAQARPAGIGAGAASIARPGAGPRRRRGPVIGYIPVYAPRRAR